MRITLFGQKKTDRNKSVRPSPYFLIWPIHPTAYGGGGILGSYVKNDAVEQTAKKEENVLSIGIQRFVNTVNVLAIGRLPSIREYMKALANYAEGNILNRLEAGEDAKGMQMELEIMLDVANKGISTKTGDRIFDERYAAAVVQLQKVLKSEF